VASQVDQDAQLFLRLTVQRGTHAVPFDEQTRLRRGDLLTILAGAILSPGPDFVEEASSSIPSTSNNKTAGAR
jgi:hypothetical protein